MAIKSNTVISELTSRNGVTLFRVDDTEQLRWAKTENIEVIPLEVNEDHEWTTANIKVLNASTPVDMLGIAEKVRNAGSFGEDGADEAIEAARDIAEAAGDIVTQLVLECDASIEDIEDDLVCDDAETIVAALS